MKVIGRVADGFAVQTVHPFGLLRSLCGGASVLRSPILRHLPVIALHAAFLPVAIIFLAGRLDAGFVSAILSPWVVQCAGLFLVFAVAAVFLRRPLVATACVGCALWAGALATPTLVPHEPPAVEGSLLGSRPTIRTLFANVWNQGEPSNDAASWMLSEEPDLVGIAELSAAWEEALQPLEERLPYVLACPRVLERTGVALYSKFPIVKAKIEPVVPGAAIHIEAVVEHPQGRIRVFVIHPQSPRSAERTAIRDASLEAIARRCAASDEATIVMGDFNETPFGQTFGLFLETTGYHPARDAAGFTPSWPARLAGYSVPAPFRVPIDHVLASDEFVARSCHIGQDIRSDHLPIVAELALLPDAISSAQ
jgi:endonuclease/exonuclease/phosphatase (EEP) superfamily protein YafD